MPLHDVTIYTTVRVKVCGIEADTQVDAIHKAQDVLRKHPGVLNRTFVRDETSLRGEISYIADAEDLQGYLVDVRGDEEFENTNYYSPDERALVTGTLKKSGSSTFEVKLSSDTERPWIPHTAKFTLDADLVDRIVRGALFVRELAPEGKSLDAGELCLPLPDHAVSWYRDGKAIDAASMGNILVVVRPRFFKLRADYQGFVATVTGDPLYVRNLAEEYGIPFPDYRNANT